MNLYVLIGWGFLAFLMTYILTPLVRRLAFRVGALDQPDPRKIHHQPMPRLGGLAIYLVFVVIVFFSQSWDIRLLGLLLGGTIIVITGIIDDIRGLSAWVKLLVQILAAFILFIVGIRVDFLTNPFNGLVMLGSFAAPITIFWIVGITNALNLIDGLDGLATGTAAIASATLGVIALMEGNIMIATLDFVITGACLGFLRYNFYPAKIFLGDSGSLFLGFNLAALSVLGLTKSATIISLIIPVVVLGIPIMDTSFATLRRYLQHKPIFQPDKEHFHHRFLEKGWSQKKTVLVIYGVNGILGMSAILLNVLTSNQAMVLLAVLVLIILLVVGKVGMIPLPSGRRKNV